MKTFWGYNSREEAERHWGSFEGIETTEIATDVVDDPTKWPQTHSQQRVSYRIAIGDNDIEWRGELRDKQN